MTKATAQTSAADAHRRLMLAARSGLTHATTANHAAAIPTVHVGVIHPLGSVAANPDTRTTAIASADCIGQ